MKKILIIGFVWPEPNSTAAGKRMLQLINVFLKNNYKIIFGCAALKTPNSYDLKSLGITEISIALNHSSFDEIIKNLNPSIVLFDRYLTEEQYGWRIDEHCPDAIKILDTEDLHFLRNAREKALKNGLKLTDHHLKTEMAKREIASIYRCDLSLIISKFEMDLLVGTFKIDASILFYIPFLVEKMTLSKLKSYPTFDERLNFMTIGNFRHEPNYNAVLYLKNEIWPLIRKKLPNAQLLVYGAYASQKVNQLENKKEGFIVKGWIENCEDAFKNSRVCLAPIQFGAGLKGKLLDAMLYGTPSITTTHGAEAMHHDDLLWNGAIENDPIQFTENAVKYYTNKNLWENAQKNGLEIVNKQFSKEDFAEGLLNQLEFISGNLETHRSNNFIGMMLQYHLHRSTKYLSKWIEEKNN